MQDVQNLRCVRYRSWRVLYLANTDLGCFSGFLKTGSWLLRINVLAEFLQVFTVIEFYASSVLPPLLTNQNQVNHRPGRWDSNRPCRDGA